MFAEFLKKNEFFDQYMDMFAIRFTVGNLEMEDANTDIADKKRLIEFYNNKTAFTGLIKKNPDTISPYDAIDVAYIINNGCHSKNFRRTQVDVKKAKKFFPVPAYEVPSKMYSLFNAYYNIWCDLPIYEREARFHIEFVRLQPFEDGNKRTARIITSFNLCKQNKAPIIINGKETDEYFKYIDDYDVEGLTNFFEKKSREELDSMIELLERICGNQINSNETENSADISVFSVISQTNLLACYSDINSYKLILKKDNKKVNPED